jgi:hypothetical protein
MSPLLAAHLSISAILLLAPTVPGQEVIPFVVAAELTETVSSYDRRLVGRQIREDAETGWA